MKITTLFALALAVVLTATAAYAEAPVCTGDRHKDVCACDSDQDCNDGKSCVDGVCVTPSTTTTTLPKGCETDDDCSSAGNAFVCVDGTCVKDPGCPDPAPCQPVTCNCDPTLICNPSVICAVDVCSNGKCSNGAPGTDGAGTCVTNQDCPAVVNNTNTTITVNRCPDQESLIPCRRLSNGRLLCPRTRTPRRILVPYTKAKAAQGVGAKNPLP